MPPVANFSKELKAFEKLMHPASRQRILILFGKSGNGKTTFINHCSENLSPEVVFVPVQLRPSAFSIAEMFFRSVAPLGGHSRLPRFTKRVDLLHRASEIKISGNQLTGFDNRISVAMTSEDPLDREYRLSSLTDAWFDDISSKGSTILVALDAYEKATTEVKEWIAGPFLSRVAQTTHVRALLAGQEVPDSQNIEWGRCCAKYQLTGVPEAREWMPIVQHMKRRIPYSDSATWLAGVCHALKGHPQDIMQAIESLSEMTGDEE